MGRVAKGLERGQFNNSMQQKEVGSRRLFERGKDILRAPDKQAEPRMKWSGSNVGVKETRENIFCDQAIR